MSFQIPIQPSKHVAARFVDEVRNTLLMTFMGSNLKQTDIARKIGVHRSVVHRELKGFQDMTMGRVAELAWAMGKKGVFTLEDQTHDRSNVSSISSAIESTKKEIVLEPPAPLMERATQP